MAKPERVTREQGNAHEQEKHREGERDREREREQLSLVKRLKVIFICILIIS